MFVEKQWMKTDMKKAYLQDETEHPGNANINILVKQKL